MVRIRKISPVDGKKSMVGRICGTGTFLAGSGIVREDNKDEELPSAKRGKTVGN